SINKYYNELKSLGIKVSKDTLYTLFSYMQDIYLILPLKKYENSPLKQERGLKKVYVNDTGIASSYNLELSRNIGRLLENVVFLELARKDLSIHYFKNWYECDFLVEKGNQIISAMQVCYELNDSNRTREVRGLISALNHFGLKEGYVLTYNQVEEINSDEKRLRVLPVHNWLLRS
ncbi:MAG: DUF4143 domain-containing protein, partial [Spirochaetota bacterium]